MAPRQCARALEVKRPPAYSGAEALVYMASWFCRPAIVKVRVPKSYRHRSLDEALRTRRTIIESKAMKAALEAGVSVPALYFVDPVEKVIVMEYVEGQPLAELLDRDPARAREAAREAGLQAGRLHRVGIAHGDLTTSNIVVGHGRVYMIDFGLASLHADIDDKAVDIHLFMRSLESTHPEHVDAMMSSFLAGYLKALGEQEAYRVVQRAEEIRMMGRYREERRRSVWGGGEVEQRETGGSILRYLKQAQA